ncbi:pantetheine-phosphate adenylyltransferase [Spirochaeta cellobiosiphila]|uniref:pantetheine-phosphate adenylyltransferase n=1 Tax=Spirochaeta cellobiosiphila TaxID=504483 RepID=UPI0003FF2384|nr:pantetheine-phosphate adenylyltransferase [Spirochaeta cellobiosiphila]
MIKAVLPGSFDPPTNGHINIIERAAAIFDTVDVVISVNTNKKYLFSAEERFEMLDELTKVYHNVSVHLWNKLIVDYAKNVGATVLVRGVRAFTDFGYEFELSMLNKDLDPDIETIFLPTDPKYFVLRSSAIKELTILNSDISKMVPSLVEVALRDKLLGS